MAHLSIIDQRKLEKLLEMGGGYVLDFSNRTFEEFVADSVELGIYDEKYEYGSGSKANRLRGFLKVEANPTVAKLIRDLIEYALFLRKDIEPELVKSCNAIADRLEQTVGSPASVSIAAVCTQSAMPQSEAQRIRAFISYSWDSEPHKIWTRMFADTLASNGIEIILDQYDLRPGDDRHHFMESSVRDADAVLCVCTPNYVRKANSRTSGVGVETSLLTPQFYDRMRSAKNFIPIIRDADSNSKTPDYLASLIFIDFRVESEMPTRMEELLRHLHREPKHRKPPVGPRPSFT